MGKKVKKKARSGHKYKEGVNSSSKDAIASPHSVLQQISTNSETPNDGVVVVIEKKLCPHIDKGVNLEKVSEKLKSSEPLRCEDCRESVVDKRAGKGRGNQGKKKGGGVSKSVWVCLDCGHFSCGGAGLPSTPQSHAVRHARQYRHPSVVKFDNPQLRWCFPCNTIIPIEKAEGEETKDPLHAVVKLIKGRSPTPAVDVEDIWFGKGSVLSGINSETSTSVNHNAISGYKARGLMNLGNTCFFNSVMQNLLAMDTLRDYFFRFEETLGPLTMSLKKLFMETNPEAGLKNVVNPKSFFGCVCAKAPQFRGYQQHDSHELLRCLLDAWCTEESNAIKQKKSSREECKLSQTDPTFVDAIFGGQLSSTVSCLVCSHSSTVYEPFLDLSLPVPTKKPISRKAQPVYQAKKLKPPPKRSARNRSKVGNNSNVLLDHCALKHSTKSKSFPQFQSAEDVVDENLSATKDCASLELSKTISTTNERSCDPQNNLMDQNYLPKPEIEEANKIFLPSNDNTWLDFLSPDAYLNDEDLALDICSSSMDHVTNEEDAAPSDAALKSTLESSNHLLLNVCSSSLDHVINKEDAAPSDAALGDASMQSTLESSNDVMPTGTHELISSKGLSRLDFCEPLNALDGDEMASLVNVEAAAHVSETENVAQNYGSNLPSVDCAPFSASNVEDEVSLQVQDSAIILLPYIDDASSKTLGEGEASSPVFGCDNQILEFDGLGNLFDEPEADVVTVKSSEANAVQAGIIVGQSSESDHEVDNSDAPVSVERCLSFFIKPELLSKDEHAWKCENCSNVFLEQKMKIKKALVPMSDADINGCKDMNTRVGLNLSEKQHVSSELQSLCNGIVEENIPDVDKAGQLSFNAEVNSKTNGMIKTSQEATNSQADDGKCEKEYSDYNPCESSNSNEFSLPQSRHNDSTEPQSVHLDNGSVQLVQSTSFAVSSRLERNEDEEVSSDTLKVKRDATKTILINSAPPILTIHLKRFSQDDRGRLSKLKGHIDFRDTIDIRPYIDPRCSKRDEYKYRLLGVVEHSGSMRGGHYVAYVRGGKKCSQEMENESGDFKWYHASDAYVHEVKLEEVLRCEAYILFYEKI